VTARPTSTASASVEHGAVLKALQAHLDNQLAPDDVTPIHRRELCLPSSVQYTPSLQ
jgi:hypothetical protein